MTDLLDPSEMFGADAAGGQSASPSPEGVAPVTAAPAYGFSTIDAQLAAGHALYLALKSMPCACRMAWQKGSREVVARCRRCEALVAWESATGITPSVVFLEPPKPAVAIAQGIVPAPQNAGV